MSYTVYASAVADPEQALLLAHTCLAVLGCVGQVRGELDVAL